MSKYGHLPDAGSWMAGLTKADAAGYAAGGEPECDETWNPYKRYEHRRSWQEGFQRRRKEMTDARAQGGE